MSKKNRELNRTERAAAIRQAQSKGERRRLTYVAAPVIAAIVAAVTISTLLSTTAEAPTITAEVAVTGQALSLGANKDAANKVIVYEDFLCPYCREFEEASRTYLREAAEDGTAYVEYRPFKLLPDDYSTRALAAWGVVAENGTPQQALAFHDALFENQPYENEKNKPGVADLTELAREVGITDKKVLDNLGTKDLDFVNAANETAQDDKVEGTPTILLNGTPMDGNSISDVSSQLEAALTKK